MSSPHQKPTEDQAISDHGEDGSSKNSLVDQVKHVISKAKPGNSGSGHADKHDHDASLTKNDNGNHAPSHDAVHAQRHSDETGNFSKAAAEHDHNIKHATDPITIEQPAHVPSSELRVTAPAHEKADHLHDGTNTSAMSDVHKGHMTKDAGSHADVGTLDSKITDNAGHVVTDDAGKLHSIDQHGHVQPLDTLVQPQHLEENGKHGA